MALTFLSSFIACLLLNNKPSKRSARAERKAAHASSSRTPHRSAGSASDPYARTSRASHASRRPNGSSTNAYGASNYGSSTHVSPVRTQQKEQLPLGWRLRFAHQARHVYSRNAHDREILRAKRERTKKRRKRIALGVVAVCLALVLGGVGAAWAYINNLDKALNKDVDADLLNSLTVTDSASDPFYMLLIGIDKDEGRESSDEYGGSYRTDSMILARIDPKDKQVTLISIPRDTQVTIGTHGTQRSTRPMLLAVLRAQSRPLRTWLESLSAIMRKLILMALLLWSMLLAVSTLMFSMKSTTRITWDILRLASNAERRAGSHLLPQPSRLRCHRRRRRNSFRQSTHYDFSHHEETHELGCRYPNQHGKHIGPVHHH